ncbi:MAG: hypothetical protein ABI813_01620 [Bacteroidota bacterium]
MKKTITATLALLSVLTTGNAQLPHGATASTTALPFFQRCSRL